MPPTCRYCKLPLDLQKEQYIFISKAGGGAGRDGAADVSDRWYRVHIDCFEKTAGKEYVP